MDIICKRKDFFKNPEKLPLNKLFLQYKIVSRTSCETTAEQLISQLNNSNLSSQFSNRYREKVEKRSALDKCWIQTHESLIEFQPYFGQFDDVENQEFLIKNQKFLNYCKYLSNCTYHLFWCNLMSGNCATFAIKDFLQYALPPYEVSKLSSNFRALYNEIFSYVCTIYERILNYNHSETEYLPEDVVRQFLRKSELINVRSIYSLCFLYSQSNKLFVQQLIGFYFTDKNESFHKKELKDILEDISQDLDNLSGNSFNINSAFHISKKSDMRDLSWLEELCSYTLELTSSLTSFLRVYEPAIEVAHEREIPNKIPQVYKKLHTDLQKIIEMESKRSEASRWQHLTWNWSTHLEIQLVTLFHVFVADLHSKILSHEGEYRDEYFEMYLGLLSIAMDEEMFIKKYASLISFEAEFQKFSDAIPNFDQTQTDYLLHSLASIIRTNEKDLQIEEREERNECISNLNPYLDQLDIIYDTLIQYLDLNVPQHNGPSTSTASNSSKVIPEPVCHALKLYVMIKRSEDSTPDLDIEIENVPRPPQSKIDECIKAVSEMLPDLDSPFILKCLEEMNYQPEVVISRILDGELPAGLKQSIMKVPAYVDFAPTKKGPEMVGYQGKRSDYSDANELLNAKSEDIKNFVLKASNKYDMDDDYDDRIDTAGSYYNEDDSKMYRHIQQPELFVEEESSSEEEEPEVQQKPGPKPFCEDPAVVRARYEARRTAKFKNSENVAGKAKGNGLESDNIKKSRDNKATHKGSRANHNRKGGAQWKHSRGMIPS